MFESIRKHSKIVMFLLFLLIIPSFILVGIDSNYFWADHLYRQNRYDEARAALQKALQAPPRPGRELADQGRRGEIDALLKAIKDKQD